MEEKGAVSQLETHETQGLSKQEGQKGHPEEAAIDTVAVFEEGNFSIEDAFAVQVILATNGKERRRFERFIDKLPDEPEEAEKSENLAKGIGTFLLEGPGKAIPFLEKAKNDARGSFFLALSLHRKGDLDKAEKAIEGYLKKYPDDFQGHQVMIEILRERGEWEEVKKRLRSFRSKYKDVPDFHYSLGLYHDSQGEKESAFECYSKALELDPEHVPSLHRVAFLKEQNGEDEEAMKMYELIQKRRPAPINSLINLGLLYEEHNLFEKAVKCYQEILKEYPNHPRAKLYLKDAEASTGMYYDEERERKEDRRNQVLRIPITDFELSVRSRNCLAKMNINTLGDLIKKTETELLSYKNFGETSLAEIKCILQSKNLRLGTGREEEERGKKKEAIEEIFSKPSKEETSILDKPVSELELSVRCRKAMVQLNVYTLGDLVKKSEADLLACKNFGVTSLNEVKQKLNEMGLRLKEIIH